MRPEPVEEWRQVLGFPDYEVSNRGRLRTWRQIASNAKVKVKRSTPLIMTPGRDRDGYRRWLAVGPHGKRSLRVAVQVATLFIGPRPEGKVLRHLNCDSGDDRVENLRWGTQRENIHDSIRAGRHASVRMRRRA